MSKPRKVFEVGQVVEVQRDTLRPWESATYHEQMWRKDKNDPRSMRGWHRVKLDPGSPPRYIDRRNGMELLEPTENTVESWFVLVPTQRIRTPKH